MSLELIGTGSYRADFYDINKRRVRMIIEAPNKKEAVRTVKRLSKTSVAVNTIAESAGGTLMTLTEALSRADREHYRDTKNRKHVASISRSLLIALGDTIPITRIDTEAVQRAVVSWKDEDFSNGTINRRLALLSKVLRMALDWSYNSKPALTRMPTLKKLKEDKGRTRILSLEEEAAGLAFFKGKYRDIFVCLLDSGMRVSELLGACNAPAHNAQELLDRRELQGFYAWSEINWQSNMFHIWVAKSGSPRTVPLSARVVQVLEKYKGQCMPFWDITPDNVAKEFSRFRKHLGLAGDKGFSAHACRHTFATRMWKLSRDIYLVKKYLGHSSIVTTERYTHLDDEQLTDSMALFNDMSMDLPVLDT